MTTEPLVLYSTITELAFRIGNEFYGDVHYVWCAPVFDAREHSYLELPPSSSPYEIYLSFQEDISRNDRHGTKIPENKKGLRRGVAAKRMAKVIDDSQESEILYAVRQAQFAEFKPMILVIPFAGAQEMLVKVPARKKASPMSQEFILPELPRGLFDIIRP